MERAFLFPEPSLHRKARADAGRELGGTTGNIAEASSPSAMTRDRLFASARLPHFSGINGGVGRAFNGLGEVWGHVGA